MHNVDGVYAYDLETGQWTREVSHGRLARHLPTATRTEPLRARGWGRVDVWFQAVGRDTMRHGHTATVIDPHHLLIFGGSSYWVRCPTPASSLDRWVT
jgi:hypothetical protein